MTHVAARAVRVLIVDDEPLSRAGVATLLDRDAEISIVEQCSNGGQAVRAIAGLEPDIVFLDIQMPGMSGFDVIRAVGQDAMPVVVFLTAFDDFALNAFSVHAVDYVLKPFETGRFLDAVQHAKHEVRQRALARAAESIQDVLGVRAGESAESGPLQAPIDRVVIREAGRVYYVDANDIDWIEGADYYSQIHARQRMHLVRQTLTSLASSLDARRFMRVHRSAIVHLGRVQEIRMVPATGDAVVVLKDGSRIRVSRARRSELEERLARYSE